MAFTKTNQLAPELKTASLLAVLLLAKVLTLVGREISWSAWSVVAFFWQDVLIALAFGALDRMARRAWLSWTLYGAIVLYTAVNVPITRLLSSPLTLTMLRATRSTLADSIRYYVNLQNVGLIFATGGLGILLPLLLKQIRARLSRGLSENVGQASSLPVHGASSPRVSGGKMPPEPADRMSAPHSQTGSKRAFWVAAAVVVLFGPLAVSRIETDGLHRNAIAALITSIMPRSYVVSSQTLQKNWRTSPLENSAMTNDLTGFRGNAAGRNVILVLLESTGAEYLKSCGATEDPTPNLTQLAERALVFENTYAVYPESIKGLFSILCSQYPALDTNPELYENMRSPSLAATLAKAGYRTALFHSGRFMYLGMESIVRHRGFQTLEDAGDIGGNHNSSFGIDEPAAVQRILQWIDAAPPGEKFFITYLPIAGHHPYDSPGDGPFSERDELGRYRNALHYGDAAIGELLRGLRARGLDQKTLFVFAGDHGEAFGQHEGNFGHTLQVYEENIRVPLVFAAPGAIREQVHVKRAASLIDIAPTVLDLIGQPLPGNYQGASMLEGPNRMSLFFTDYSLALLGLRDAQWKYIHELASGRSKLFKLESDPLERTNLARLFPERAAAYRDHLQQWSAAQRQRVLSAQTQRGHEPISMNRP